MKPTMFADLLQWISRRPAPDYDRAFIRDVRVRIRAPRNPRVERFILICWILIAIKHVAVIWAVHRYHVPFHQLWVNAPTWFAGLAATLAYYLKEEP
ncbi:MAG TPA: hypothetical protein VFJ90_03310 [Candidatus Didemnitutus sp.]|nr:hypothetical protein [Candidatus Didemnitutus sp.]